MTASGATGTWWERHVAAAQVLSAALLATAAVLTVLVWRAVAGDATQPLDTGETFPLQADPYGRELIFQVPGAEVVVTAGPPVETIDHQLLEVDYDDPRWDEREDLVAADGGLLVPLSWTTRPAGGFADEVGARPIEIRLVAGDQTVDLGPVVGGPSTESLAAHPLAVAVDGDTDPEDVTIEVEFDGVTQIAHLDSGEIDAGVAQHLYDGIRSFTADCRTTEEGCDLAADPGSPLRPDSASFSLSFVTLYPYDATLGWADEGRLWAGVQLQLFGVDSVESSTGAFWPAGRFSAPRVTLDGDEPVHTDGLGAARFDTHGRVVFSVAADAEPRELAIEQVVSVGGGAGAPDDLPLGARLELTPVG